MDLGIAGKVAFVGGGSKGMGRASARLLAANGCRAAIVAREQGSIDEAVAEMREGGGEAIGVSTDLATRQGINEAVAQAATEFGSPDIVVGLNSDVNFAYFDDFKEEIFEDVFRNLTVSQIHLARATIPEMRRK